jgi:hypothetical protein
MLGEIRNREFPKSQVPIYGIGASFFLERRMISM